MDLVDESYYIPEERATYQKIKKYVKDKYGVNVHTSYIAQVKQCSQEKVEYINEVLRCFGIIS